MRAVIYLVLGIVLTAVGWFWNASMGVSAASIHAPMVMGLGLAFVCAAIGAALDKANPTMRKLGRK